MKQVFIINDILGGCLGEKKVFWNYMLDGIPNIVGVDWSVVGKDNFESNARDYIRSNYDINNSIIIQNATCIGMVDDTNTIVFLQDNLRGMGRSCGQQETNIKLAKKVVANSIHTAKSYIEYDPTIIPIGIDDELFCKMSVDKSVYNIPTNMPVGIFVGAFDDVKGWNQVKRTIEQRPDVFFILVSKFPYDVYYSPNSVVFNRIDQELLANLMNCADFFILGSPVETQCLAALEASFCGLPVVMNNTGIFMDWEDRELFGVFGRDFNEAITHVTNNTYDTRTAIMKKGFGISDMIEKWKLLLESM